jgi:hypothetical protein
VTVPNTLPALVALFVKLGARDPEGWASSQLNEGINQLHRFLFLRQAWACAVAETNTGWIDYQVKTATTHPNSPFSELGEALSRALAAGVSRQDLVDIVRGAQGDMLSQLCYMLEDNGLTESELAGVGWGLFETDEEGNARAPIYSLHESVLEADPTGREMKPRVK